MKSQVSYLKTHSCHKHDVGKIDGFHKTITVDSTAARVVNDVIQSSIMQTAFMF